MHDLGMILSGEIRCSSLLWVKGLNVPLRTPWSAHEPVVNCAGKFLILMWLSCGSQGEDLKCLLLWEEL